MSTNKPLFVQNYTLIIGVQMFNVTPVYIYRLV